MALTPNILYYTTFSVDLPGVEPGFPHIHFLPLFDEVP